MSGQKKIVIVGATSAIAEHCARLWVQREAVELVLVGRDAMRLESVAADLKVRSPQSSFRVLCTDFLDSTAIQATVDAACAQGVPDIVLIAHGALPEQRECETSLAACRDALALNGLSPVLFAEAFAGAIHKVGRGTIALIGSVAGDRGRKSNYVYGSAKGMVARYAQGLQHRFAGSGIKVVLLKPGPTDTPMTSHLKAQGAKLASVESVAGQIVPAIERGSPVAYVPGKWRLIMQIIRHLPGFVFNKLNI